MDKTTLARLLTGLALSSSWGCFDEFNRLEEKTLSGVAQELASILGAIGGGDANKTATLNGTEVTYIFYFMFYVKCESDICVLGHAKI